MQIFFKILLQTNGFGHKNMIHITMLIILHYNDGIHYK